jgi:hypothetical protein
LLDPNQLDAKRIANDVSDSIRIGEISAFWESLAMIAKDFDLHADLAPSAKD